MAIRAAAGEVHLVLRNEGRETANPPIHFHDTFNEGAPPYSYGLWVKATTNIPSNVTVIAGTDGSQIQIFYDGSQYKLRVRSLGIEFDQLVIGPATIGAWSLIVFIHNGPFVDAWFGTEVGADPNSYVTLTNSFHRAFPFNFTLDYIAIQPQSGISMANFKYWNTMLTIPGYADQMHNWDTVVGGEAAPMWVSSLRTPGDISNTQYPYTSQNWGHGHAFSSISDPNNIVFDPVDPAYMAKNTPCPTWVYTVLSDTLVSVNPGVTPATPTYYPGTQYYQFADKGSVPITTPFQSIRYYAWPHKSDARQGQLYSLPIYRDQAGVGVTDITQAFETDTGVSLPAAVVASNFYDWVYGCTFRYDPPAGVPTADAGIRYQYLYVKYIGKPTGVGIPHVPGTPPLPPVITPPPVIEPPPVLPTDPPPEPIPPPQPIPVAMSGLFVIKAGTFTDKYGPDIELKIPNPTIRTAFIGE